MYEGPTGSFRHLQWYSHGMPPDILAVRVSRNHIIYTSVEWQAFVRPLHRTVRPWPQRPLPARHRRHRRSEWCPRFETPIHTRVCLWQRIKSHPVPIGEDLTQWRDPANNAAWHRRHSDTGLGDSIWVLTISEPCSSHRKRCRCCDEPHAALRLSPASSRFSAISI